MQTDHLFPELALLRETFQQGITRDPGWRRTQLRALEAFLVEREAEIAAVLYDDLRKSSTEVFLTETGYLRGEIRFALRHLKSWMKPHRVKVPLLYQPAKGHYSAEPYGVVLVVGAWNYPLQLCLEPLISAIAAGNCAVIKPSEFAPQTSALLKKALGHYLEPTAFCVVEGGVEEAKALLQHRFDYIFYTGSQAIGREVMSAAARHLTPLTIELGGKCPCVVDEHSDIHVAGRRIVWAKFLNAGQTCLAPDYVLVHHRREQELLESMQEALVAFYGDDPGKSEDYPRIVNEHHVRRLERLLQGSLVWSGGGSDVGDRYVAPTILTGVTHASPVMQEEIFGPLLPVIPYTELDEALATIRYRAEPLAIYLFSSERDVQQRVLLGTRSGALCINDLLVQGAVHGLPFGGIGGSGFGACHGQRGFETFSMQRSVLHRALSPDPDTRYPPYSSTKFAILKWLMNWTG